MQRHRVGGPVLLYRTVPLGEGAASGAVGGGAGWEGDELAIRPGIWRGHAEGGWCIQESDWRAIEPGVELRTEILTIDCAHWKVICVFDWKQRRSFRWTEIPLVAARLIWASWPFQTLHAAGFHKLLTTPFCCSMLRDL